MVLFTVGEATLSWALLLPSTLYLLHITVIGGSNELLFPKRGGGEVEVTIASFEEHLMSQVSHQETGTQVPCRERNKGMFSKKKFLEML